LPGTRSTYLNPDGAFSFPDASGAALDEAPCPAWRRSYSGDVKAHYPNLQSTRITRPGMPPINLITSRERSGAGR
jgi:hypothetical protein